MILKSYLLLSMAKTAPDRKNVIDPVNNCHNLASLTAYQRAETEKGIKFEKKPLPFERRMLKLKENSQGGRRNTRNIL